MNTSHLSHPYVMHTHKGISHPALERCKSGGTAVTCDGRRSSGGAFPESRGAEGHHKRLTGQLPEDAEIKPIWAGLGELPLVAQTFLGNRAVAHRIKSPLTIGGVS